MIAKMKLWQISYHKIFLIIFFALFLFVGCDKPLPADVLSEAKFHLTQAEAVKADEYAPELYKRSSDLLTEAINLASKDPEAAKPIAVNAKESAKKAYKKALRLRAADSLENIKGQKRELVSKNVPLFFQSDFSNYTSMLQNSISFFEKESYLKSYKNSVDTELKGKNLFVKYEILSNESYNMLFEADSAIKNYEKIVSGASGGRIQTLPTIQGSGF